jgi:hypothetical protein
MMTLNRYAVDPSKFGNIASNQIAEKLERLIYSTLATGSQTHILQALFALQGTLSTLPYDDLALHIVIFSLVHVYAGANGEWNEAQAALKSWYEEKLKDTKYSSAMKQFNEKVTKDLVLGYVLISHAILDGFFC